MSNLKQIKQTIDAAVKTEKLPKYHYFFNDKLKDGGRSIKAIGWKKEDYENAVKVLSEYGYNVTLKTINYKDKSCYMARWSLAHSKTVRRLVIK